VVDKSIVVDFISHCVNLKNLDISGLRVDAKSTYDKSNKVKTSENFITIGKKLVD